MGFCACCGVEIEQPNPKFYVICATCMEKRKEWFFNLTGKTYVGNGLCKEHKT